MGLELTAALAAAALAIALFCGWMGARPTKVLGQPRLVPWRFLMMLAFAFLVAVLVHLVALLKGG
ncbi:MAG TPA: hypothetical protein VG939_10440 [Caulobacteraceae bacterium]|nr:hypothetical protein [Caulobacteraceae bacterium]